MTYQKFNNNPLFNKTGDCVIRAIAEALDKTWVQVYDDLYKIGRSLYVTMNSNECMIEYLKDYQMTVPKVKKGQSRLKVKDFNSGTYILCIANHVTVVKNGVLKDLWDCREKVVYRYWQIEK